MSILKLGIALIELLIGKGFLHGPPSCPKCKLPMHLISASGKYTDNCCWICNRTNRKNKRKCVLEINVRYQTVFEGSRLTIPELQVPPIERNGRSASSNCAATTSGTTRSRRYRQPSSMFKFRRCARNPLK